MRHVTTIASRELRSLFVSPVAYVVLTLWSVIAGTFFLASLLGFQERQIRAQQFQAFDVLQEMNLNDHLVEPFIGSMWVIALFLLPAITMGLVASEKANGTEELLLTSPLSTWDIVFGKFLAGLGFVGLMTLIVSFFPALLFMYGAPEIGKTLSGLLALLLVSSTYVAIGVFGSSITRSQLIAFIVTLVLLVIFGMMLPFIVDISIAGTGLGQDSVFAQAMRWIATGSHLDRMLQGLIDTADLAYFVISSGIFLLLSKTVIESARWR
ncbi:MAG: ABC transporter permease subunit [Deltaproteobacteria bacterium]|nr:ABC transporter permease subunit [Deltaproteobacteria bacterium]